jgi:hypothetical protein
MDFEILNNSVHFIDLINFLIPDVRFMNFRKLANGLLVDTANTAGKVLGTLRILVGGFRNQSVSWDSECVSATLKPIETLKIANEYSILEPGEFNRQRSFTPIWKNENLEKQKLYNSLVDQINDAVKPIDDYLFRSDIMIGHGSDSGKTNGFSNWLEIRKESLLNCPSDYTLFLKELALTKNVEQELTYTQKLAEKGAVKIKQLLTSNFNTRILPLLKALGAENFKQYSSAASILIFMNAAARMDSQSEALKKFTTLLKTLNNFVNDFELDIKVD